ncbi:RHS repeat-associated core domain-containing protein [Nitrosomonas eutropha]|uniref:RHS repeat-associated core domain-containing protein n=1 Tax=Nitrosomonas eutropha TaxID=916 RepID=UPI000896B55A|nr:RHS repeat-associated core domain-containing protein [Nitrosomonas eutropha]SDV99606.1 RHS repeat-associated core domain-containing protein [Nitrosomonas eutropha]
MISLEELGLAYRKAKVDLYYSSHTSLDAIADYEENLHANLQALLEKIQGEDESWISVPDFLGSWIPVPKSIDMASWRQLRKGQGSGLIFASPACEWKHACKVLVDKKIEQLMDANGNITSLRKRNGQSITLAYDNLNRLLSRSYPTTADNITYTYDLLGRTTAANKTGYTIGYVYDNAGRLTSTTAGSKTLAYQYDPAGNRTRLTWPETAFYVTSTYDALNRPTAIKETGTVNLATYVWDDLSRRTTVTLGNSTTTSYAYSTQSALSSLTHNLTGTAQDQTYSYTRNQAQEIASQSWTNDLYQWTGYANGTRNYTANGLNQYTIAAGATLTHDTKGNLTGDGVWTYTYDLDNQLISANKTGSTNSLAYDGAGRLRQTTLAGTVTGLTYDGVELVAEYNSGGTLLRRYVHGPGIDEPLVWYEGTTTTAKTWPYQDQLGSVIGTANSAGTSTAIHSYGPFGEPNTTTGIRFRYTVTGQQFLGSLNLYHYKTRFYSPALGRFLQTDPIGTTDDLNLYAYVGNNPINFSDPSGLIAAEAQMLMGKVGSWGRDNAGTLAEIGIGLTPAGVYADICTAATGRLPITGDSLSG